MNFWTALPQNFIGLAPMDGVTDAATRHINAMCSNPDVIYTEFISVDGIAHEAEKLFTDFLYSPQQRPIVAQIYGTDPDMFYISAQIAVQLGFDGIDINMGCPAKSVRNRGAGAALIANPTLAASIIKAVQAGSLDASRGVNTLSPKLQRIVDSTKQMLIKLGNNLDDKSNDVTPVSVKTRIGVSEPVVQSWIAHLLQQNVDAIALHGRTLKQMYSGQSNFDEIAIAAKIVADYNDSNSSNVVFMANGDITTDNIAVVFERIKCNGVLLGRTTNGNPWAIEQARQSVLGQAFAQPRWQTVKTTIINHAKFHLELKGDSSFVQLRKHFAWYVHSFDGASQIRAALMKTQSLTEVEEILDNVEPAD